MAKRPQQQREVQSQLVRVASRTNKLLLAPPRPCPSGAVLSETPHIGGYFVPPSLIVSGRVAECG